MIKTPPSDKWQIKQDIPFALKWEPRVLTTLLARNYVYFFNITAILELEEKLWILIFYDKYKSPISSIYQNVKRKNA